jgi:hypothetical protein
MRKLLLLAPLALAACGGGSDGETKNESAGPVNGVAAGLWELSTEVTSFQSTDDGQPRINTPEGSTSTETVCVGEEERPPTELLSGPGLACTYSNYYLRNGRLNVSMNCTREGVAGTAGMSVDGRVQADTLELNRSLTTYFTADGDVQIVSRVTGRRTGDCPAGAEAGGAAAGNAQ